VEVISDLDVAVRWAQEKQLGDKVVQGFLDDQLRLQDVMDAPDELLMKQAQDWKLGAMATRRFLDAAARLRQQCSDESTLAKLPQSCAEKGAVRKPPKKNHANGSMVPHAQQAHDSGNASDHGVKSVRKSPYPITSSSRVPVLSARSSGKRNDRTRNEANSDISMISTSVTPSLNGSMNVNAMPSNHNRSNNNNHVGIIRGPKVMAVKNHLSNNGGKDARKTRYCRDFFSDEGCRYGAKCRYAHSVMERTPIVRRRRRGGRGNGRSSRGTRTY
jgi:hypothetical protein